MAKLKGTALADEPNRFVNLGNFEMADNPRGTPSSSPTQPPSTAPGLTRVSCRAVM
jgi:hypothetical protein